MHRRETAQDRLCKCIAERLRKGDCARETAQVYRRETAQVHRIAHRVSFSVFQCRIASGRGTDMVPRDRANKGFTLASVSLRTFQYMLFAVDLHDVYTCDYDQYMYVDML